MRDWSIKLDNSLEAFASNPRYSPDGLDGEIDKEEWATAERVSAEQAAIADLQQEPPKIESQEGFDMMGMHEKILGVVDNATRVPRDIVGGVTKAIDNTMSLAIGRENVDAANQWLKDEMPELVKITSSFEKGIAPQGTVSEVTQELSQFAIPFGAYMKGLKALSVAGGMEAGAFTTGFLSDIITSGTALDPHVERLSTMARDMGVDNKIVGWLADNENETDSEGRLKNILENTGLGLGAAAAITSVVLPLKGMWRLSKEIPNMPRSPSMGSPQAQRGSVSMKDVSDSGLVKSTKGEPVKKVNEIRASKPKESIEVYHSTGADFKEFDPEKGIGGQMWFTSRKDLVESGYEGAASKGRMAVADIDIRNPAGWEEYDKFSLDELMAQGYDGLKLVDDDQVTWAAFFPEQVKVKSNKPVKKTKTKPDKKTEAKMDNIIKELKGL